MLKRHPATVITANTLDIFDKSVISLIISFRLSFDARVYVWTLNNGSFKGSSLVFCG